jgi:hypothetical protein
LGWLAMRRAVAGDLHLPASLICLPNVVFPSRIGDHLTAEGRIGAKEIFSRLQAERFISFVKLFAAPDLR